jgi:hypothetical protein
MLYISVLFLRDWTWLKIIPTSCKQFVTSFSGEGVSDQLYQRAFQLESHERVIARWPPAVVWAGLVSRLKTDTYCVDAARS